MTMKDPSRQPTSLKRLEEIIDLRMDETSSDMEEDTEAWLRWTYNFLSARKVYHKKAAVKTAILRKMAETLLSKDELNAIDAQAEITLSNLEDEPIQPSVE